MRNKLLLTLWLVGAVLYTGSTLFLAQAVLGGIGGPVIDKSKPVTLAAAAEPQCEKADVALDEAGAAKAAAPSKAAATKTAAIEPERPAAAQASPKQPAQEPATRGVTTRAPANEADEREARSEPSPDAAQMQDQAPSSGDEAASLDDWQGREAPLPGAGQDAPEEDEWASVVAGTADMRSEPDLQAPLIYALPAGWHVRVISRQPGWVQVQDANSGAAGWVEATAIAPSNGPGARPRHDAYGPRYGGPDRYAEEGYPDDSPPWRRRRSPVGEFGDFLRRALDGF